MTAKIDELKSAAKSLKSENAARAAEIRGEIEKLETQKFVAEKDFSKMSQKLSELESKTAAAKTAAKSAEKHLNEIRGEISAAENRLENLRAEISKKDAKIKNLEKSAEKNAAKISAEKSKLAEMREKLSREIAAEKAKILNSAENRAAKIIAAAENRAETLQKNADDFSKKRAADILKKAESDAAKIRAAAQKSADEIAAAAKKIVPIRPQNSPRGGGTDGNLAIAKNPAAAKKSPPPKKSAKIYNFEKERAARNAAKKLGISAEKWNAVDGALKKVVGPAMAAMILNDIARSPRPERELVRQMTAFAVIGGATAAGSAAIPIPVVGTLAGFAGGTLAAILGEETIREISDGVYNGLFSVAKNYFGIDFRTFGNAWTAKARRKTGEIFSSAVDFSLFDKMSELGFFGETARGWALGDDAMIFLGEITTEYGTPKFLHSSLDIPDFNKNLLNKITAAKKEIAELSPNFSQNFEKIIEKVREINALFPNIIDDTPRAPADVFAGAINIPAWNAFLDKKINALKKSNDELSAILKNLPDGAKKAFLKTIVANRAKISKFEKAKIPEKSPKKNWIERQKKSFSEKFAFLAARRKTIIALFSVEKMDFAARAIGDAEAKILSGIGKSGMESPDFRKLLDELSEKSDASAPLTDAERQKLLAENTINDKMKIPFLLEYISEFQRTTHKLRAVAAAGKFFKIFPDGFPQNSPFSGKEKQILLSSKKWGSDF